MISMVVDYLHVEGIFAVPTEDDAPLFVDADEDKNMGSVHVFLIFQNAP
jgi:hypothetical protein